MKSRNKFLKTLLSFTLAIFLSASFSIQNTYAQSDPLSLGQVLVALQSQSSGLSLSEKNALITKDILTRGITFTYSAENIGELTRVGASPALLNAVRTKSSRTTPVRNVNPNGQPVVEFDNIWVDYNVVEDGVKGMRVHTKFTLRNLKDEPLSLTVRVQKEDGDVLSGKSTAYKNKSGQLAAFGAIKPAYDAAVFSDFAVFIPYSEFDIAPGKYNLKLDADIIYRDGELLKHLALHPFTFTQPGTNTNYTNTSTLPGSVKLDRMWIDYNVTRSGVKGMLVHTKMTVNNLKDQDIQLALVMEKADGGKVFAKTNSPNRAVDGRLTFYKDLSPKYVASVFNDIQVFIPYSEIVLPAGSHEMRIHGDIISRDGKMNIHINYLPFKFSTGNTGNYY